MDGSSGPIAREASPSGKKPLLEGNFNPVDNAAAEAGPPLTPLGQPNPQQASAEPSPVAQKEPTPLIVSGQNRTTLRNLQAAAAAAAAAQRTAPVAPPRTAAQPAPRQNPIIINAMSAVEEHGPWLQQIPSVPVYSPTAEEWKDPIAYIRSIQPEAGKYGACVVKAPVTPAVPAALLLKDLRFTTRLQKVKDEPWGKTWQDGIKFWDSGRKCTLVEYAKFADEFARRKLGLAAELPTATVESLYWREKENSRPGRDCTVEYGNDIEGSAFHPQDPLGQTNWNLNSFSDLPGSALRWCLSPAPGVTTPMLYIGMLYATFAWHVEDHFMYSINYSHAGASKVWYCVPASAADDLESTAGETVYLDPCTSMIEQQGASQQACNEAVAEALAGKTTTMSPKYLVDKGIPVYRAVQDAGSYIITFPRSYHSGFSTGFNLGEAVNFVLSDWWPFGEHARRLYKSFNRQQILSHEQVLCDDACGLAEKLEKYKGSGEMDLSLEQQQQVESFDEDRPMVVAFVAMIQQVHQQRKTFQEKNVLEIATCSPTTAMDAPEMRASIPCTRCHHLSYLVSAVVGAEKPQDQWEHICLDCAADAFSVFAGDDDYGPDALMLYVKPLWSTMENTARKFTSLLGLGSSSFQQKKKVATTSSSGGENEGGAAVEISCHPMLSLEGCSGEVIQDPETLSKYTWTDLDDPMLFAPSWVGGKQQERPIAEVAAPVAVGVSGGVKPPQSAPLKLSVVPSDTSLRKRSREDEEKLEEINQQEDTYTPAAAEGKTSPGCLSPTAIKSVNGAFSYHSSTSLSPTFDATLYREDTITLPGVLDTKNSLKTAPRLIYKLGKSDGEMVIRGSDILKIMVPNHRGSNSVSRWLGNKLFAATNSDVTAPDKHLIFIKGNRGQRSPALGKSGALVLVNSEKMKKRDDYVALCAALGGVWDDVDIGGDVHNEEDKEHGVAVTVALAPAGTSIIQKPGAPKVKNGSKHHRQGEQGQVFLFQNGDQFSGLPLPNAAGGAAPAKRQRQRQRSSPLNPNLHSGSSSRLQSQQQQMQQTMKGDELFIQHAVKLILEETEKYTAGFIANSSEHGGVPLQETPGSIPDLKRYYLPYPSSSPLSSSEGVLVVAAYHMILKVSEAQNRVASGLCRWIRGVVAAPGVTRSHILCLAPLLYHCENWKNSTKTAPATFVLTLDQCAIIYFFGLDQLHYKSEITAGAQKRRMYSAMVSIWGEGAVCEAVVKVVAPDFVSNTPLGALLEKQLFSKPHADSDGGGGGDGGGDGDAGGDDRGTTGIVEDQGGDDVAAVVNNDVGIKQSTEGVTHNEISSISSLEGEKQPLLEPKEEITGAAVSDGTISEAVKSRDAANKRKFVAFPSLFKAAETSLLLTSQRPFSAVNMEFSVVADPEEVDIEIEAENNRKGKELGGGNDGGDGGDVGEIEFVSSEDHTTRSTPTPMEEDKEEDKKEDEEEEDKNDLEKDSVEEPAPASETLPSCQNQNTAGKILDCDGGMVSETKNAVDVNVNVLPPLDADVLDLMEAEVFGPSVAIPTTVATAAVAPTAPMPPPSLPTAVVGGGHGASEIQKYNAYHALSSLYLTERQHQYRQYHQHHQQGNHHHQLMAGIPNAPVVSLQNPQVMLSGNNWDGTRAGERNLLPHSNHMVDTNRQMDIVPLFVAPQQQQQQQEAPTMARGGGGGMALSRYPGWNMGNYRGGRY